MLTAIACLVLSANLHYGSVDYAGAGQVTQLQTFLQTEGYFPYQPVGVFGPVTFNAVRRFQIAHGISPTGFVGPLTRAAISQAGCSNTPVPVPSPSPVTLYFISPAQGAAGTSVNVTGFGFTNDNTILLDGMVAAQHVPVTSSIAVACTTDPTCRGGIRQTLVFTVPQSLSPNCPQGSMCPMYARLLTPDSYQLSAQNANGTSNTTTFIVTGGAQNPSLSITGLDAPAQIPLGTPGTWVVHVSTTAQNLQYSVVWGDEYQRAGIMAPSSSQVQANATFAHAYGQSGTYTPTFTVSDGQGHTVSTSATVTVTPLY